MSKEKTDLLQGTLDMLILKGPSTWFDARVRHFSARKQLIEERSNWERLSAAINTVLKTT